MTEKIHGNIYPLFSTVELCYNICKNMGGCIQMTQNCENEYLYHYTSIENLALILKNRTIRLNALHKMDDLQEQRSHEGDLFGRLIFVSSWTAEKSESIPMWKMYTPPTAGVRIGLPPLPFVWHNTKNTDIVKAFAPVSTREKPRFDISNTFLDIEELCNMGIYSVEAFTGDILHEVQYTSEREALEPSVYQNKGDGYSLRLDKIGLHKNTHWQFQKEWRYRMGFYPLRFNMEQLMFSTYTQQEIYDYAQGKIFPTFSHFDLDIDCSYFKTMVITPSPQISLGNRILLETLVDKYNPSASIRESELINLI